MDEYLWAITKPPRAIDDAPMARHLVSWGLLAAASLLVWAALAAGVLLVLGYDFAL